jgi:hypothetical protein
VVTHKVEIVAAKINKKAILYGMALALNVKDD